jgi:hypothetical protein
MLITSTPEPEPAAGTKTTDGRPTPNPWAAYDPSVPFYLAPPSTSAIRAAMRRGELGAILNPASGNKLPNGALFGADNAVFGGKYPGDKAYLEWLGRLAPHSERALWATAPDIVGDHFCTYARSRDMLPKIREFGFPAAFVAQDGMEFDHHMGMWEEWDVLFIGGTTAWKMSQAAVDLAIFAIGLGKCVHLGRCNSLERLRYAQYIGATTADGTYTVFAPDKNLQAVLRWRSELTDQEALFDAEDTTWL